MSKSQKGLVKAATEPGLELREGERRESRQRRGDHRPETEAEVAKHDVRHERTGVRLSRIT